MYFEINVSKGGHHYFATAERSIQSEAQAHAMYTHFLALFPATEGYEIMVTRWDTRGTRLQF